MTAGPRASASGERYIIAREIEANRPRRSFAARFTKARPAEAARYAFVCVSVFDWAENGDNPYCRSFAT